MRANEIVEYLQQFMDSNYKKVLINGEWGIGKTKYISDFINDYSNTCYVSLFGKKDVDTVIQEIYFQILDRAPKGKFKKSFSLVRQKMNSLDISISGVSLSVPVIQNMLKALSKELTQRENFVIVFDDLERRHDALDIKEIFGLIDSLSKIENIKIVVVAATNHINNDHKVDFDNFKEKAIDREYTIDEYAKDAPKAILGDEVWKVVENIAGNLKFKNLRTFEKIRNFIDEVTQILGEEQFTDKFTRADLYRMCFAIVFFRVEHKGEMVLLDSNPKNELFNTMYSLDNGDILYLSHHILKNSLENDMCRGVFPHIKNWFETGSYSIEDITSLITNINNHQEEPHNFYSSESQVEAMIDNTRSYIRNLKGNEKITDIIANLTSALSWCEVLSVDFGFSENEIIELIQPNILIGVNGNISSIDAWSPPVESEDVRKIISKIKDRYRSEYIRKTASNVNLQFNSCEYNNIESLNGLQDAVMSNTDELIKIEISEFIKQQQYFFPLPTGKITEEHWNWCTLVFGLITRIERYWNIEDFYNQFKSTVYSLADKTGDRMLMHRLNILFDENRKNRY